MSELERTTTISFLSAIKQPTFTVKYINFDDLVAKIDEHLLSVYGTKAKFIMRYGERLTRETYELLPVFDPSFKLVVVPEELFKQFKYVVN